MQVTSRFTEKDSLKRFCFTPIPNAVDIAFLDTKKFNIENAEIFIELLPQFKEAHNDVLALVILLQVIPFTAKEIMLDFPVSAHFSDTVKKYFKRTIGPVDSELRPRAIGKRHALAFSGGADSCAALSLMPKDTISVFLSRTSPEGRKTLYKPEAAIASCEAVRKTGRKVHMVETNLEYGRSPVGFPCDYANASPAIIHADTFDLRSVNFGMILESACRLGDVKFLELYKRSQPFAWFNLFNAAGINFSLPTSGLSEILTAKISCSAEVRSWLPQSCVRGDQNKPCMNCYKCFRKQLMEAAVTGIPVQPNHFKIILTSKEVRKKLEQVPIHHEIGMAYSIANMPPIEDPFFGALRNRLAPVSSYGDNLGFLNCFYHPMLRYIDEDLRDFVHKRINEFAPDMTDQQVDFVKNWDGLKLSETRQYQEAFEHQLKIVDEAYEKRRQRAAAKKRKRPHLAIYKKLTKAVRGNQFRPLTQRNVGKSYMLSINNLTWSLLRKLGVIKREK